jgi:putative transposase
MRFEQTPYVPDDFYRNHLPHFDPKDAPYSVTYRLYGSVPKEEMQKLLAQFQLAKSEDDKARAFLAYDAVLDRNGPYYLQEPAIRQIVMDSLAHMDRTEIHIYAYTIMPNHVHAVFDLNSKRDLYSVMQSHKTFTARRANAILGLTGNPFWQQETYDHVVRKGRLGAAIWYVLLNPVKAGLVKRWQDWPGTYLAPEIYGFEGMPV